MLLTRVISLEVLLIAAARFCLLKDIAVRVMFGTRESLTQALTACIGDLSMALAVSSFLAHGVIFSMQGRDLFNFNVTIKRDCNQTAIDINFFSQEL